jgi:hypothetical protein
MHLSIEKTEKQKINLFSKVTDDIVVTQRKDDA